jgi:hypothetical protein
MGNQQTAKLPTTVQTIRVTRSFFPRWISAEIRPTGASFLHNRVSIPMYKPQISNKGMT